MTWHARILDALRARGLTVAAGEHYLVAQCDHATLAAALREAGVIVDALIVDAPYSERTHAGHDGVTDRVGGDRREIDYAAWSGDDVGRFLESWSPLCAGWICSLTDHVLSVDWAREMEGAHRCVFSPIACVERARSARLQGDGPSQWATWMVVSRPRSRAWQSWGTLDGAYVGGREAKAVVGGKPLWLMRAIVGDYSAPGDLVCDPCAGAGTTLVAAVELGRRAIGCEPDAGRFETACKRLTKARPQLRMRLDVETVRGEQSALALGRNE